MVLDDDYSMDMEEHAAMLQNKALIQNNVISKRKEQLKHWENSEMNRLCPRRRPSHQSKVKFQDRDIFLSACQSGDEEEVEDLLKRGSDINVSSIDGVTALHQAVIDGNADIVRFLVAHGADINAQDNEGWTPLHAAVCCGNLPIAKFLMEHGSDLTCVNSDRELPVDLAESDEMRAYLEQEMRKRGFDEQKSREREFNLMLEDCNRWIQLGKYVDSPHPRTGATALHVAASKGYNKLIGMLIRAGANINAQDFEGWTPLHAAAHWGERDACRILMENGASLDALTHTGHSVLAVSDKSIEEYLYGLKEKFNELRSDALQQQQQSQQTANGNSANGVLQDASNLATSDATASPYSINNNEQHRNGHSSPGLHGAEKLQSTTIRRISSVEKLAIKRKDMESDENLSMNSSVKARLSPPMPQTAIGSPMPIPTERQSLVKREEMMMNGGGVKMDLKKSKSEEQHLDKSTTTNGMKQSAGEDVDEEEEEYEEEDEEEAELEDESEWTEVTATPSSSCSVPAPQHQQVPTAPLSPSSYGTANDRNNAMRKSSSSASNNIIATGAGAHRTTIVATQTQTPPKDSYAILKTTTTMSGSNRKEQPAPPPPAQQQQETTPEAVAIVKLPPLEPATNGDISSSSLVGRSCSLSAVASSAATGTASSSASSKANRHVEEEKSRGSSRPSPNKEGSASGGSTREGSNSSNHSSSPFSSDRSNTGSGVSSIHTTSRSVTPKDASRSSSLYSSDQNIHCTVRVGQPGSGSNSHSSASAATSSSFTSSTTTNHSNKSGTNTNHKSAVLRAAEETVKRLRQQLPNVQAQVGPAERGKSQSVDYGKPTPLFFDPPLKSPPASAPLVQSARLFWNSITNSPHPSQSPPQVQQQMQQNHPIGSTQLHQQQFNRSRQRFIAANQKQPQQQSIDDSSSPAHSPHQQQPLSPFALVAGEQQQQKPPFRRGESLKIGLGGSGGMSFATPPRRVAPIAGEISTTKQPTTASASSSSKQDEFLFGKPAAVPLSAMRTGKPAPIAAITSASNTPESQSCCSSVTPSPSPSPIVLNSPFVTIRKQSWQQSTPPTQPTSQKESESERKAKSKLKRSTRRSTQGVTLEQLGEATGRLHAQNHQHQHNGRIGGTTDRIQQANAKFNQMMEQKTSIYDPSVIVIDQLQPPSSPGCSSASSSSAYITAPNNSRHHQHEDAANGDSTATMPIANFSSTALLIDELNKYKQLYEKERDENDRLRLQVQELSADTRAKVSNQMRGLGWRPGVTLIQRTELPSGITYSTVTRPADQTSPPEERQPTVLTVNGIESDSRHAFEKRIAELESEVERVRELQMRNDQLKSENESLVRILAKHSRNNYNNNNNNLANIQGKASDPTGRS